MKLIDTAKGPTMGSPDNHFVVVGLTIVGMVWRSGRRRFSAVHFYTGKLGDFRSAAAAGRAVGAAETEANR